MRRWEYLAIAAAFFILGGLCLSFGTSTVEDAAVKTAETISTLPTIPQAHAATTSAYPTPIYVSIASTTVAASLIPVGITTDGHLDTPHNFIQAGWYEYGALPGQPGNVVIDGHVDNGASTPGPFKHLDDAKVGDIITVTDSDGASYTYKIISATAYDLADFPANWVFHETGGSYLKIITCHGTFMPSQNTYDQRLVVNAVLISQ